MDREGIDLRTAESGGSDKKLHSAFRKIYRWKKLKNDWGIQCCDYKNKRNKENIQNLTISKLFVDLLPNFPNR